MALHRHTPRQRAKIRRGRTTPRAPRVGITPQPRTRLASSLGGSTRVAPSARGIINRVNKRTSGIRRRINRRLTR